MAKTNSRHASAEIKFSKRGGRHNNFSIQRFINDHGFQIYALENTAEGRKIFIPRFIFGQFRAELKLILKNQQSSKQLTPFEHQVSFLNREYFYFRSSSMDLNNLIIQDIEERDGSSGYITVGRSSLQALDKLLYSEKLQHPNDVLEEIISYHQLFQFSFVKGSKSITSALALRKDVLQTIERYTPRLAQKVMLDADAATKKAGARPAVKTRAKARKDLSLYRSKLGERLSEKNIEVDYEEIFGDQKISLVPGAESDDAAPSRSKAKAVLSQFYTPLEAGEIKKFETGKFQFELSTEESSIFRDKFINDRAADFYLGFEIVDALFTFNRTVKTFRFPLYYGKVRIRESGRGIHLELRDNGRFYLNHLALGHLVEKFTDTTAGVDHVDKFFNTLLAQDISVDQVNDRICLSRHLPIKEGIFDRTREILLGYKDENGKGGILGDLKVKGIECDLTSVYLYRAPKLLNPIDQALEIDLGRIKEIAHQSTSRFYRSLLGTFLTPELDSETQSGNDFAPITWMPGMLPQSTRALVDGLNQHDLVLLEGPPGTGKTHTIMNLLIHCINSKQRILVVSDQQAAIEALVEKLQDYLIGSERGTPAEQKWNDLLFGAIKVIDEVETGDHSLEDLTGLLTEAFKPQDAGSGSGVSADRLEKRIKLVKEKIAKLTAQVTQIMLAQMGEDVTFDRRVLKKDRGQTDIKNLLEFLDVLQGKNARHRELIDSFVRNRFNLIRQNMEECYPFFKVPGKNFDSEIKILKDDLKILSAILKQKPRTIDDFHELTKEHPRHEIIRYLESVMQAQVSPQGRGLARTIRIIRSRFNPPLIRNTKILLHKVEDQVALLKMSERWSDGLWGLLREIHESIRIGDEPSRALGLYRSIEHKARVEVAGDSGKRASIQGILEEIDNLYVQHDKVVKECLESRLHEIVRSANASKSGSGTNNITSILSLIDNLKQFNSVSESGRVFDELRQKLFDTFPVWLVRKQMVPFLLPCIEQSFDLLIIDEATQCRVDDSISLMFRAKKMLVVGDDNQTVLQKNSVIDDYLFKDHELDEHLRNTQARGFKGGGSNIFALVKSIKQASVMLNEHYRCPPEIIEYSNKYVYESKLKIMQWSLPEHASAVDVDSSEQKVENSKRAGSGKFKGIETQMVDRYFDYVLKAIKNIERTTKKKINIETDVALCYFLLKNEPYMKFAKDKFLKKLNRGEDVLDGAGAALQGKERDYIFYFWDMTRYNMGAFKQGDDADKRKGELNVLMSRPKKKAFHFLHRNFDQLDHSRTQISSYLSRVLHRQEQKKKSPEKGENALNQSFLGSLLLFTLEKSSNRNVKEVREKIREQALDFRQNIVVGDAGRVVDLIAFPVGEADKVTGLVDLSGFGSEETVGQNVVDYFFQLKRAAPGIDPLFVFPHELINENGQTFHSLIHKLELARNGKAAGK